MVYNWYTDNTDGAWFLMTHPQFSQMWSDAVISHNAYF